MCPAVESARTSLLFTVLIAIALGSSSCSILLPVRAARVNHRHPPGELELGSLNRLPGHPRIRVITTSGETLQARFAGVMELDSAKEANTEGAPPIRKALRLRVGDDLHSAHPRYAQRSPYFLSVPIEEVVGVRLEGPVAGVVPAFVGGLALDAVIGVTAVVIAVATSGPVIQFGY